MSTRPSDWSPLTGGDPCPGDPSAWDAIVEFWAQRSRDIDGYREKLYQHTSVDAEGKTFGRLEGTFSDGAGMASLISYEFEKASDAARSWQRKLEDMQSRADEALRKAKAAKTAKDDAQIKADGLKADAAKDKSPDPIIAVKLHGLFGGGGLEGEIADAQADIEAAQKVVDDIRGEYARESASAIGGYELASVAGIYAQPSNKSLGGNPFSSSDEVRGHLWDFDPFMLSQAFGNARQNPESFPKLLDLLSEMTPQEMKSYFSAHQEDALFAVNPAEGDATQNAVLVQKWWNAELRFDKNGKYISSTDKKPDVYGLMSEEQRQTLMEYAPGFVGNMQGVAYSHRSMANINLLKMVSTDSTDRKGSPYEVKATVAENVGNTAHQILAKQRDLQGKHPEIDVQIPTMEFSTISGDEDSWNDIKAAASVGNLDSAGNVSYIAHGINTNPEGSFENHVDGAEGLYRQMRNQGVSNHATVAWMNYEAPKGPPNAAVWSNDKAHEGGHRFAQDIDTLNTVRGGKDNIRVNAVGHSYGTDVVFSALTEMKTKVDSASMLASAGLDKDQVEKVRNGEISLALEDNPYQVGSKNFYYSEASKDWVYEIGRSPWSKDIPAHVPGATEFSAETDPSGKYEDVDGHDLFMAEGGNKQGFLSNTTARRDLAYIVGGEENRITHESPVAQRYSPYGNFYYPAGVK